MLWIRFQIGVQLFTFTIIIKCAVPVPIGLKRKCENEKMERATISTIPIVEFRFKNLKLSHLVLMF